MLKVGIETPLADNDVVNKVYTQHCGCHAHAPGDVVIFLRRCNVSAWMIVGDNQGHGVFQNGRVEYFARVRYRPVYGSDTDGMHLYYFMGRIQGYGYKVFLAHFCKALEHLCRIVGASNSETSCLHFW
jgi:hypothetical protein